MKLASEQTWMITGKAEMKVDNGTKIAREVVQTS